MERIIKGKRIDVYQKEYYLKRREHRVYCPDCKRSYMRGFAYRYHLASGLHMRNSGAVIGDLSDEMLDNLMCLVCD